MIKLHTSLSLSLSESTSYNSWNFISTPCFVVIECASTIRETYLTVYRLKNVGLCILQENSSKTFPGTCFKVEIMNLQHCLMECYALTLIVVTYFVIPII